MQDTILDAKELANYIIEKYSKIGGEISPLKLQKSLYFCFAYWGGFVRRGKNNKSELSGIEFIERLFPNKIEAWVYGPVVPDVYDAYKKGNLSDFKSCKENPFDNNFVKNYIDGILNDVLKADDFKLVEVSHKDDCWINHFNADAPTHNVEIPPEEIIKEYARI